MSLTTSLGSWRETVRITPREARLGIRWPVATLVRRTSGFLEGSQGDVDATPPLTQRRRQRQFEHLILGPARLEQPGNVFVGDLVGVAPELVDVGGGIRRHVGA